VELQVRDARVTDVARITSLLASAGERGDGGRPPDDVADLLRQLVYLPNATVVVAVRGREVVGAAMLSLRPSVMAGGLVGTVDLIAIDPEHESEGVDDALLAGVLRSARNKGCVTVEAEPAPDRPIETWTRTGFIEGRPRLVLGPAPHRSPA
jgi:ribosomal protein S18 acetylase RimI-like enzyme